MQKQKLKEIYEYDYIPNDSEIYPLQEWFNAILEKTEDELTIADVCRMLRQRMCSKCAMKRAVDLLREDPFAGEIYEGQLMSTLYGSKEKYLCLFYADILPILENAEVLSLSHKWANEEEKSEYLKIAEAFKQKIADASH
ncbi:MAG: hypothetical protein E7495_07150 [Ruminococcus flavefaciens]|nr:hypothetical protein [Ruminococcus flavefaciens]